MPEFISHEDMEARFHGGPRLGKAAVLVVVSDRCYTREGNVWRRLDNRVHRTIEEMTSEP